MSTSIRRSLAAVIAASCTLGVLAWAFTPPTAAPAGPRPETRPIQAQNVIVIPGPDQVSNTINTSGCAWLNAGNAAGHPMSADSASCCSLLLATPLAAAEYAVNGMTGVARLYGC